MRRDGQGFGMLEQSEAAGEKTSLDDAPGLATVAAAAALPQQIIDPLAIALAFVARHHGFGVSIASLTSGLPLTQGRLTLTHLPLAAERAQLSAQQKRRAAASIRPEECPLLIVLKDGDVAVLVHRDGRNFSLRRASAIETPVTLKLGELKRIASKGIILLSPRAEFVDTGASEPRMTTKSWLREAFLGTRGTLGVAIIATLFVNIFALVMPLFTMNIYDRVIPNAALNTLYALSIGALLMIGFDFLMRTLRAEIIDITGRRVDVRLANALFGRLIGAKLSHKPVSAGVQTSTLRDFESVREFFQSVTVTTLGDIPFAVLFLAAIYILAGPLVLTPLIAVPVTLGLCLLIQLRLKGLLAAQHHEMAVKNAVATEVVIGLETIKALGAESWAAEKWERSIADGIRQSTRIRRYTNLASHIVMAAQLIVTVLMVFHGVFLAMDGVITTGALIAGVMLAGRALSPVGQAALLLTRVSQTKIALRSLSSIIEAEQERDPSRSFVTKETIKGDIAFEGVSFAYEPDMAPALNAVNCGIKAGEKIGILGSIGSGKSAALKAIVNLVTPQAGRIFVDGIAAPHLDPAILRKAIGFVPQEAMLFRGTIRQNITIHCPFASDEAILSAVQRAGANWISRLPKGLDTPLGERGLGLSGGQRQAIALARCLVGRPSVLLLDEPTGSLDGRSETALLGTISAYCAETGATLIIVTHRPAVLDIVDRLMVFEDGRLTLDGPKQSVLQTLRAMTAKKSAGAEPVQAAPQAELSVVKNEALEKAA